MGDFAGARAYWKTVISERYERYMEVAPEAVRGALERDPSLRNALQVIVDNSDYLAEALIQAPDWLLWLDRVRTSSGRAREDWSSELAEFLNAEPQADRSRRLTAFQRREYLRIMWRDLRGVAPLGETVGDLSALADAILAQAYAWNWNQLATRYGTPRLADGSAAEMVILGGQLQFGFGPDVRLQRGWRDRGRSGVNR
jgi:glutamine synthetase adenylyltransferase